MQAKRPGNRKIIDVSHHQGEIDWAAVQADGVHGAFIKVSEGIGVTDAKFAANAAGAKKAGLTVGFYHYAHPERSEAVAEATFFASVVRAGQAPDFPHVLDVEGAAGVIGADKLTAWCIAWLEEVERLTGHPTMIYTGASFAKTYLGKPLAAWPLWVAHYGVEQPMANATWSAWSVFQFTSNGHIKGISGDVDINAMEQAFFDAYAARTAPHPANQANNVKIIVNGKLAAYGRLIEGRVYLPLRQLGDALGVPVEWKAAEATPYVAGRIVTNFKLIDGVTYLGVRSAAELLDGKATWDNETKKVYFSLAPFATNA
ncbi:GH25 family lysozyme [Paenibacillus glycinis]|uniref:Glycoside hydrolase n=1 Tax=Paenibacillus glycinis TaxID=2697035 RepID=A0ABW9XNW2_9BACL|nr:GH25 family lysozyme [Paenibacillus glycinis]NBD24309.1 glycoside hydrolase [Paenibacillus glycinis]